MNTHAIQSVMTVWWHEIQCLFEQLNCRVCFVRFLFDGSQIIQRHRLNGPVMQMFPQRQLALVKMYGLLTDTTPEEIKTDDTENASLNIEKSLRPGQCQYFQ